jgi:hypothetical protein
MHPLLLRLLGGGGDNNDGDDLPAHGGVSLASMALWQGC